MTNKALYNPLLRKTVPLQRIIGERHHDDEGPLCIVFAGVHGNEPSGVQALQKVFEELEDNKAPFRGTFVGVAGNLAALKAGSRFLDEDLNRIWLEDRVDSLRDGRKPDTSEERELKEIHEIIERYRRAEGKNFFLDCHTTSSESVPYISVPTDAESVQLAGEIPVHSVIGSGDHLTGVSDRYLIDHGFTGFTFEAGRHHRLASVEAQRAAIWVMLHRVGCLKERPQDPVEELARTQVDGHKYYEVEYVHKITPEHGFRMKPGFCNFEAIRKGDLLAWEKEKPVLSHWDARLFLPLYQEQGDDGFSIIREESEAGED